MTTSPGEEAVAEACRIARRLVEITRQIAWHRTHPHGQRRILPALEATATTAAAQLQTATRSAAADPELDCTASDVLEDAICEAEADYGRTDNDLDEWLAMRAEDLRVEFLAETVR